MIERTNLGMIIQVSSHPCVLDPTDTDSDSFFHPRVESALDPYRPGLSYPHVHPKQKNPKIQKKSKKTLKEQKNR
jgi:hypothetical protein